MSSEPEAAVGEGARAQPSPRKAILGQVRFAPIPGIAETATVERLREAVKSEWPEFAGEQVVQIPWGQAGAQEVVPTRSFRFSTADGGWAFVLTPGSLTLEATADVPQRPYREFAHRFSQIWGGLRETVAAPRLIHQGLRYTNVIERGLEPDEWRTLINTQLLGPLGDATFASSVIETISEFRLKRPPDALLVLKHGIARAGQGGKTSYVLDMDQFVQHRPQEPDPGAVEARFDEFDESMRSLFGWCVTDPGIAKLP